MSLFVTGPIAHNSVTSFDRSTYTALEFALEMALALALALVFVVLPLLKRRRMKHVSRLPFKEHPLSIKSVLCGCGSAEVAVARPLGVTFNVSVWPV